LFCWYPQTKHAVSFLVSRQRNISPYKEFLTRF
jgi:hypothetical protein